MTANPREQLERLRGRVSELTAALAKRWAALTGQAEQIALQSECGRARFYSRCATTWTKRQEKAFQANLRSLAAQEAASIRAMLARLSRLTSQADAQAKRLGLNEPWRPENGGIADQWVSLLRDGKGPAHFRRGWSELAEAPSSHETA